jgi:tetratricopeptide (TPR) repeat protein/tRNA A-37 threonylcarbamoyl transferase component Bud32
MSEESRILELLEDVLDSGRTPEEVCADDPALLFEVGQRLERFRRVEAQIDAVFPPTGPSKRADRRRRPPSSLPVIPGYEVQAVLGHGGMGVVYKARHLKLNRPVAIKMLLSGQLAAPDELTGLMREAEAAAGLRHPNIVQVYDVGDLDGLPYFTMEFVEGGSLGQKLGGVPQPSREAAPLLATLAAAVHVAHQGGVVHRDLKPSNVLLTSDGTPKITDFGLARRAAGDATLTTRRAKIGTPSYMAPEQALGKAAGFCPAVDVYSLGAILYETLTGRPPFHAETASETQRQLIQEEPVPPTRLNARVRRDLETICLKCLRKEPDRRYATAEALADDLRRFERGDPIQARRIGRVERAGKWVRRRPGLAAAVAFIAVLSVALVAASLRLAADQAQRREAIEADIKEVADLQRRALWDEARTSLDRAESRLKGGGAAILRSRLVRARRDLDLVIRLDRVHLQRLADGELPFYKVRADREYSAAFDEAGLIKAGDDAKDAATRVNASAVRGAILAAVHDWAGCTSNNEQQRRLLTVANLVDPDPTGWRQRVRNAVAWNDLPALAALAGGAEVGTQPVPLLLAVGERLRALGGDSPAFLRRVQSEHPADFWANLTIGDALVATSPEEAGGYYRAAVANRPGAAVGYTSLGDALGAQKLPDEALRYHRRAVQVDPRYPRGHTNLGNVLLASGRTDEAIVSYQTALRLDPNYAWAHFDLANTLRVIGRADEALQHYRRFHELEPSFTHVTNILRADLVSRGRGEEVRVAWEEALKNEPADHDAWFGYAELCLFLGREDEYRHARSRLLGRFGRTRDPYVAERVSRAALLLPPAEDELRAVADLADMAVAAGATVPKWIQPYFLFAQGLAEYRRDRFDSAISIMRGDAGGVMGPAPRLVIAMAESRKGNAAAARKALAAEMTGFDWAPEQAGSRDDWIFHVLRREAETTIIPDLPALLDARRGPLDDDERLIMLGAYRSQNRTLAAARLYAELLARDPPPPEQAPFELRFKAACAAASAGVGSGRDATQLGEVERARWRKQALAWLRADLASWKAKGVTPSPADHAVLQRTLTRWKTNPDLARLREPISLQGVSDGERQDWATFWQEVDHLGRPSVASD